MKNKGKVLFIMIYAAVLLTMGAVTITLYDNAKASMTKQVDAIQHIYQELSEKLSEIAQEDLRNLLREVYKTGCRDGIEIMSILHA